MRADSGFYTHDVRFSITVRLHQSLRNIIEALDADPLLDGRRRRLAETSYAPFQSEPDAAPVRHRTPGGPRPVQQLSLQLGYHASSPIGHGETLHAIAIRCTAFVHQVISTLAGRLKDGRTVPRPGTIPRARRPTGARSGPRVLLACYPAISLICYAISADRPPANLQSTLPAAPSIGGFGLTGS